MTGGSYPYPFRTDKYGLTGISTLSEINQYIKDKKIKLYLKNTEPPLQFENLTQSRKSKKMIHIYIYKMLLWFYFNKVNLLLKFLILFFYHIVKKK